MFYNGVPRFLDMILGLVVIAGGLLPVLSSYGVVAELPPIPNIVLQSLMIVGGLALLANAFKGTDATNPTMKKKHNLPLGLIVLAVGVVTFLSAIGVITSLPTVPLIALQVVLVVGGLVLFLDGLLGASNYWNS